MGKIFQLVVEGSSDVIVLKRLLGNLWSNLSWKGESPLYYCSLPEEATLCIRELKGYQSLQNIKSELSLVKELGDCCITKNLLVLDADTPKNGGGFETRREWVVSRLEALPPHSPVELFLLPDDKSDGTLETLLLQARAVATKSAEGCLQAFCDCLNKHKVPYPLEEKMIFSLYAWLFDKTAASKCRVDTALKADAVVDFKSSAFQPLETFLKTHLVPGVEKPLGG